MFRWPPAARKSPPTSASRPRCRPSSTPSITAPALVLASHLGRPKGKPNPEMSLKPVAVRLERAAGQTGGLRAGLRRSRSREAMLPAPGQVLLLENLRYHAAGREERSGVREKAGARCATSTSTTPSARRIARTPPRWASSQFLSPAAAGLLMEKELKYLGKVHAESGASLRRRFWAAPRSPTRSK